MVSGQISADLVEWLAADQKVRTLLNWTGTILSNFPPLFFAILSMSLACLSMQCVKSAFYQLWAVSHFCSSLAYFPDHS